MRKSRMALAVASAFPLVLGIASAGASSAFAQTADSTSTTSHAPVKELGVVTITGLGITFTEMVITLAQSSLVLALVLTAMAGIVLGMGMPTTPAYIVMVALLVPAVIKLGAVPPAAHMFAFYFAILSAITPPVALAVFAAASLAKADLWAAGLAAVRIGATGFIVPFMFVYEPALLVVNGWAEWHVSLWALITASIGCVCLAASLHGWMRGPLSVWQRMLIGIAALLLIKPGIITDAIGFGLLAVMLGFQFFAHGARTSPKAVP